MASSEVSSVLKRILRSLAFSRTRLAISRRPLDRIPWSWPCNDTNSATSFGGSVPCSVDPILPVSTILCAQYAERIPRALRPYRCASASRMLRTVRCPWVSSAMSAM
ncbi:hypothetical protein D9M68_579250 [compost metagenome]